MEPPIGADQISSIWPPMAWPFQYPEIQEASANEALGDPSRSLNVNVFLNFC